MKFQLNCEEITFNICRSIKQERDLKLVLVLNHIVERCYDVLTKVRLGVGALVAKVINF